MLESTEFWNSIVFSAVFWGKSTLDFESEDIAGNTLLVPHYKNEYNCTLLGWDMTKW